MPFVEDGDMVVHSSEDGVCLCVQVLTSMLMTECKGGRKDGGRRGERWGYRLFLKRRNIHSRSKNGIQSPSGSCVLMDATHSLPTTAYLHKTKSPD